MAEGLQAAKRAGEMSDRYRDAATTIRTRTDTSVKALGAIGTAAVAALGYTEFVDVFPNGGPDWAFPVLVLGLVAMICAVVLLGYRFRGIGETIITTSDVGQTCNFNHLGRAEEAIISSTYRQTAKLNGVETLRAYLARGHRYERIAERLDPQAATALRDQADLITAEVRATEDRAALFLLRGRAKSALFSGTTALLVGLFVVGWYGTALASDAMDSKRSGELDVSKECLDLGAKAATAPLPSICKDKVPKAAPEPKPDARKAAAKAIPAIAELWNECWQEARKAGEDASACAPLFKALEASRAGFSGS